MHSDQGDSMNIQFKKGVLEICVLSVLAHKDCYGYELVNEISQRIDISEGTIYPLLRRLKDDGFVTTYLQESVEGPPRKYYRLTESGRNEEHEQKEEWMRFAASVNALLERKNDAAE
jgi:PadR family transcriptional regulator PadR